VRQFQPPGGRCNLFVTDSLANSAAHGLAMVLLGGLAILFLALVAVVVLGALRWNEAVGKVMVIGGGVAFLGLLGLTVFALFAARGM
jgi:hypothetical protein